MENSIFTPNRKKQKDKHETSTKFGVQVSGRRKEEVELYGHFACREKARRIFAEGFPFHVERCDCVGDSLTSRAESSVVKESENLLESKRKRLARENLAKCAGGNRRNKSQNAAGGRKAEIIFHVNW